MKVNEDAEQLPARPRERRLEAALVEAVGLLKRGLALTPRLRAEALERLRAVLEDR